MQANQYDAHAFYDRFSRGRASGELTVSESSLRFVSGHESVVMPITGLVIKLGGASDRLVYLTHPLQPDWTLYTSNRNILNDPAFTGNIDVKAQASAVKKKRAWNWSLVFAICAFIVLMPVTVIVFMDTITRSLAMNIPASWEQELGEKAFAQYQFSHDLLDDESAKTVLDQLILPLISEVSDKRYDFTIVIADDSTLNAFALPGGYVVINSGLILKATSAEQMLGVLAHELSHVAEQHSLRNIIAASGTFLVVQALIGDGAGVMATLASSVPFLLNQQYSRDFERDADEKGVALLLQANINPQGLADFFQYVQMQEVELLEKIEDENQRQLAESTLGFLSTHPATQNRIDRIQKIITASPSLQYRNLDEDFFALQNEVKQFVTEGEINESGN